MAGIKTVTEFESIAVTRLHTVVVNALEEPILSGKIRPGEMLPSEKELAAQLKVGRRAVREALRILQNKGLVEVRMGVGAFVLRNDLDTYLETLLDNVNSYLHTEKAQLSNILQFREIIESFALKRLIAVPDAEAVWILRDNVEKQRLALTTGDPDGYQEQHTRFHRYIVSTLNNPVVTMVYEQVRMLIVDRLSAAGRSPEQQARSIAEHSEIVEAVAAGDWPRCDRAIQRHLAEAYHNLLKLR